jgi:hypothetical protein
MKKTLLFYMNLLKIIKTNLGKVFMAAMPILTQITILCI